MFLAMLNVKLTEAEEKVCPMPCPPLSSPVLPSNTLPCPACSTLPCPAVPCPVLQYLALPCPPLPCPVLPSTILPCPALQYPAQSCPYYPTLPPVPCPPLPYPALQYPYPALTLPSSACALCLWQGLWRVLDRNSDNALTFQELQTAVEARKKDAEKKQQAVQHEERQVPTAAGSTGSRQ